MSIEAMKQALEALANAIEVIPRAGYTAGMQRQAAEALRQAIEFEEMVKKGTKAWAGTPDDWVDELRGGAEKREWVGLTEDDMLELNRKYYPRTFEVMIATEAKLKEKNT